MDQVEDSHHQRDPLVQHASEEHLDITFSCELLMLTNMALKLKYLVDGQTSCSLTLKSPVSVGICFDPDPPLADPAHPPAAGGAPPRQAFM